MCSIFFFSKIRGYFIFRKLMFQHYMETEYYLFCFFYLFFLRRIIPDELLPMQNICFVFLKAVIIKRVINNQFFYRKKVWHTKQHLLYRRKGRKYLPTFFKLFQKI